MGSRRFQLVKKDWKSILRGALIAMAGGLIVYLGDITNMYDFGDLASLVAAFAAIIVNIMRKWIDDSQRREYLQENIFRRISSGEGENKW
jgi:hypothetical protein